MNLKISTGWNSVHLQWHKLAYEMNVVRLFNVHMQLGMNVGIFLICQKLPKSITRIEFSSRFLSVFGVRASSQNGR